MVSLKPIHQKTVHLLLYPPFLVIMLSIYFLLIHYTIILLQWPINHKGYAVYRVTVAVLMVGWIVADLMYESQKFYHDRIWLYLVYATNWSFVLLVLSTCFHAVCVMFYTTRAASCVGR